MKWTPSTLATRRRAASCVFSSSVGSRPEGRIQSASISDPRPRERFAVGRLFGWLNPAERGFYRLVRTDGRREQDWKGYAKSVLVFSRVFSALLYALQRLQGHLFLNPDNLPGVPSHIALNTTASFVTNTNWQYYGGEYTMSYLTQMSGPAVQQFVSAGVGLAVLAAVVRGLARRSASELGNLGPTSCAACMRRASRWARVRWP